MSVVFKLQQPFEKISISHRHSVERRLVFMFPFLNRFLSPVLLNVLCVHCLTLSLGEAIDEAYVTHDYKYQTVRAVARNSDGRLFLHISMVPAPDGPDHVLVPVVQKGESVRVVTQPIAHPCPDCKPIDVEIHTFPPGVIPLVGAGVLADFAAINLPDTLIENIEKNNFFKGLVSLKTDGNRFLLFEFADGNRLVLKDLVYDEPNKKHPYFRDVYQHPAYFKGPFPYRVPLRPFSFGRGMLVNIDPAAGQYIWIKFKSDSAAIRSSPLAVNVETRRREAECYRPALYFLYPFTIAGDVLLSPIYLIIIIVAEQDRRH